MGCLLTCGRDEAFDLYDFDVATFDVHNRNQVLNKRDLETGVTALHDQTRLRGTEHHLRDRSTVRADFQANEVFRPVLALIQLPTRGHGDVEIAYRFRRCPVWNTVEGDVITAVSLANGADPVRLIVHIDGRAWLEVDEIFVVDVEPEKPLQPVRPAESGDLEPRLLSR